HCIFGLVMMAYIDSLPPFFGALNDTAPTTSSDLPVTQFSEFCRSVSPTLSGQSARSRRRIRALLVDPSLFTAPYDAALTGGLATSNVSTLWATRKIRPGETCEIASELVAPIYYPGLEASAKRAGLGVQLLKGASHLASTHRLTQLSTRKNFDILHFQWVLLPLIDLAAIRLVRRRMPVVLTVHDTTPFNGNPTSKL
ncbi:hypothetical protein, partial [Paracoccus liaowanqingii]|uniref:hypothetical protein n=1 Tax=Paracoccus liaowanqingii TaxID=2560053 RepID=UPI001980C9D1